MKAKFRNIPSELETAAHLRQLRYVDMTAERLCVGYCHILDRRAYEYTSSIVATSSSSSRASTATLPSSFRSAYPHGHCVVELSTTCTAGR
jgi:hypothetical protein